MNDKQTERQGWLARLEERLFEASMPRVVQGIRYEDSVDYREMVRNLDTPMAPAFEREVARTLNRGGDLELIPAETLMPAMMQRFGLGRDDFGPGEETHFGELQTVCNRCPVVGRCWKAMRAGERWEKCRGFCPNAEAFEQKSQVVAG
ncbi:hypothetical protein [Halomonas korlensis]|uniref:Uncharacterized protein n=1 Tax=Halomonas korlensis TaxID=463301 RepID=A0A1I7J9X1_9GAMM|nr:hypothetical protein [Halomonas korlensis]SFU82016.1 hypothetical protein SAMN04487955_109201 [Halomonas korlensis]